MLFPVRSFYLSVKSSRTDAKPSRHSPRISCMKTANPIQIAGFQRFQINDFINGKYRCGRQLWSENLILHLLKMRDINNITIRHQTCSLNQIAQLPDISAVTLAGKPGEGRRGESTTSFVVHPLKQR